MNLRWTKVPATATSAAVMMAAAKITSYVSTAFSELRPTRGARQVFDDPHAEYTFEFELGLRFGRVLCAFVGAPDEFEYGEVGFVHPIFKRVTANRTGCVTGVRH